MNDDRPGFLREAELIDEEEQELDTLFALDIHAVEENKIQSWRYLLKAGRNFAEAIYDGTKHCDEQTAAVRKVRELVESVKALCQGE